METTFIEFKNKTTVGVKKETSFGRINDIISAKTVQCQDLKQIQRMWLQR